MKITFKHWKTGKEKTINASKYPHIPLNPYSDVIVVWNEDEDKLEDIRRNTIVEWIEDDVQSDHF
jgi:hypothetical protein